MLLNQNQVSPRQRAMIAAAARSLPPELYKVFTRRVLARLTTAPPDLHVHLAIAAAMRESRLKAA